MIVLVWELSLREDSTFAMLLEEPVVVYLYTLAHLHMLDCHIKGVELRNDMTESVHAYRSPSDSDT